MTTLWDTTGSDVVKALAAARRTGGAITSGTALTLIVVADERNVPEAETAATFAASAHPCRVLLVVRREISAPAPRLDAEVQIGGRLGPGESVVMRMYGRLALHAESVTLPLLAPDVPVVTWWLGNPPDAISHDPLGVFADRRITDCGFPKDQVAALDARAADFAPGDTDLAWTRTTNWRAQLASAADSAVHRITGATVYGKETNPTARLLAGWLTSRLGVRVPIERERGPAVSAVTLTGAGEETITLRRSEDGQALLERDGLATTSVPMQARDLGDLLAEELHRIDADIPYADALGAATGRRALADRAPIRVHVWHDPARRRSRTPGAGDAGPARMAATKKTTAPRKSPAPVTKAAKVKKASTPAPSKATAAKAASKKATGRGGVAKTADRAHTDKKPLHGKVRDVGTGS
ncbi:MAG: glucose-6-phosphate dehydrogenase assembly protein OpcA [Mycobacteriales bacterium]